MSSIIYFRSFKWHNQLGMSGVDAWTLYLFHEIMSRRKERGKVEWIKETQIMRRFMTKKWWNSRRKRERKKWLMNKWSVKDDIKWFTWSNRINRKTSNLHWTLFLHTHIDRLIFEVAGSPITFQQRLTSFTSTNLVMKKYFTVRKYTWIFSSFTRSIHQWTHTKENTQHFFFLFSFLADCITWALAFTFTLLLHLTSITYVLTSWLGTNFN